MCDICTNIKDFVVGAGDRTWTGKTVRSRDFLTNYDFCRRYSLEPRERLLWSGLSLHLGFRFRCSPSSLYTFPFQGFARDCQLKGFPEFDEFYSHRFQWGTQFSSVSLLCLPISPRPHRCPDRAYNRLYFSLFYNSNSKNVFCSSHKRFNCVNCVATV